MKYCWGMQVAFLASTNSSFLTESYLGREGL